MSASRTGVVLMAYGSPRSIDELLPYYTDIRRGVPPTDEQLEALAVRYEAIGGTSPLRERTEAQRRGLQAALDDRAPGAYQVVLGMKHVLPSIEQAVDGLAATGVERLVGLVLAPHYSAFSVGQYLDRLVAAAAAHQLEVASIESWATEPAFIDFIATDLRAQLGQLPTETRVVFTAHSLPRRILDSGDPYPEQLAATAKLVAAACELDEYDVAWQSAARTPEPWLQPDILELIDELAADGRTRGVLVSAVGFVADHLEVLYDLDIQAKQRATERGLRFARTACVNDDPQVMAALAQRVVASADPGER